MEQMKEPGAFDIGTLLGQQFRAASLRLQTDFRNWASAEQQPTKQQQLDSFVKGFLSHYIPPRFRITSGIVVDWQGRLSDQIDAAVVDALYAPNLLVAENQSLIPIETLLGVVQIRHTLTYEGLGEAVTAYSKLRALQAIFRSGFSEPQSLDIPFALFAYHSELAVEEIVEWFDAAYEDFLPAEQLHVVYVLGKGTIHRGSSESEEPFRSNSTKWEWLPETFEGDKYPSWDGLAWTFLDMIDSMADELEARPSFRIGDYGPG